MSVLGLDDRRNAGGVASYAPQRAGRRDGESTILPVLERLSRSEGREPGPRLVQKAVVHHLPPLDVEAVAKSSVPMIARLTIAAGILAATAAIAIVFVPHSSSNSVAPEATAPSVSAAPKADSAAIPANVDRAEGPKAVQTLTIRKSGEVTAPPATVAADAPHVPQAEPSDAMDPVATPLSLWTTVPADLPAPAPLPTAAGPSDAAPPHPAATTPEAAPAHKGAATHHARHVVHHSRRHVRHAAHAAAAPAKSTETETAQTQPVKKLPLQAAIDRIFGGTTNTSPPQQ